MYLNVNKFLKNRTRETQKTRDYQTNIYGMYAKDELKGYVKTDNASSNCTFLSVPKMNSDFFCRMPSQAKGHDVKLQKQQKLLSMASLKLVKTLDNLIVIKESEILDIVTSMKGHATAALDILSQSIAQTRRNDTMSCLSRDYKKLISGIPKSQRTYLGMI